jgi:Helix-turn-helix domain
VIKAIEGESAYGEVPSPLPQSWFTANDIGERLGLEAGHATRVARKLAPLHQKAGHAVSSSVHSLEAVFSAERKPIRYRRTSPSEITGPPPAAQEDFPQCAFCQLPFRPAPERMNQRYGDNCCGSEKPHRAPTENDPGCPGHHPTVADQNRDGSPGAP